jgi:hypothetical protein
MQKVLFGLFFLLSSFTLLAQANETVYKDWQINPETKNQVQVSYRIVQCEGTNQVHLKLVNSNPANQTAEFTVTITNSDTESTAKDVSFTVSTGSTIAANCSAVSLGGLRINIPGGYDPSKVSIKIAFK